MGRERGTNEQRLSSILQTVPDIIYRLNSRGEITFVNDAVKKYGCSIKELVGTSILEIVHPEDKKRAANRINERRTGDRSTKSLEIRLFTKKHVVDPFEVVSRSVENDMTFLITAEGLYDCETPKTTDFMGTQGIARDVTELKLAEERIKQQTEFLNLVLESLPHPFYVIDAFDYTIRLANSVTQLGVLSKQSTCYAITHNRHRPCGSEEHPCPVEIIKRTKQPVTVEHLHYDKDGNPMNVEINAYPIFDNEGNVTQIIESSVDITERKRIELALRESERKFRSVAQSANDAIISSNSTGNIVFWNIAAQKLFGYIEEEIMGQPLTILMPERYREVHKRGMERYSSSGESKVIGKTLELFGQRKDLSEFPMELSLATWNVDQDIFYTGIIRDITERKRVEEEREKLLLDLKDALERVKTLSGLLPICSACKKIRDDKGYWNQIESYIRDHSEADFTHSICPECSKKLYGEFLPKIRETTPRP
jgi:PAS domain S-box-containing protein